jgi:uncharacterized protein YrrD
VNSKDVKGLPAVDAIDGERIGIVERAYLDPAARRIVGFAVGTGAHLFASESSRMVDVGEIVGLDAEALYVRDPSAVTGAETTRRYGDLIDLDDVGRRHVVTEGGTALGAIASAEFDERGFALVGLEVAPGHFRRHTAIPVEQVVTIGPELVIVRDEVAAPAPEPVAAAMPQPGGGERAEADAGAG